MVITKWYNNGGAYIGNQPYMTLDEAYSTIIDDIGQHGFINWKIEIYADDDCKELTISLMPGTKDYSQWKHNYIVTQALKNLD